MFGPNTNLRFSVKKTQDLVKSLLQSFEEKEVKKYLKYLIDLLEHPNIEDHFPSGLTKT